MNIEQWIDSAIPILVRVGLLVLGALVVWAVGRRLIARVVRVVDRILARHEVDPTLVGYLGTILGLALNVYKILPDRAPQPLDDVAQLRE
jgi:small conductance mechanosensitive channel